jgi:hypothetical protein
MFAPDFDFASDSGLIFYYSYYSGVCDSLFFDFNKNITVHEVHHMYGLRMQLNCCLTVSIGQAIADF